MNKKEFFKSINDIDDRFLREGEEFFLPEEAEKTFTVYKKKGMTLMPAVSAAACCALVIAAAVFVSGIMSNMPVNYAPGSAGAADSENTEETEAAEETGSADVTETDVDIGVSTSDPDYRKDIEETLDKAKEELESVNIVSSCRFDHISYGDVKVQTGESSQGLVFNITEPTVVDLDPVYSTHDGNPVTVRLMVWKDGKPAKFSALDSTDVDFVDTVFEPNSEIEVPISFAADQNDRIISIVALFDPDDGTNMGNDRMVINFINLAFKSEASRFVQYNGSNRECKTYQNEECLFIETECSESCADDSVVQIETMVGYVLYVNGQPATESFREHTSLRTLYLSDEKVNDLFVIQISKELLKPGDVVQGAVYFGNDGNIAISFKETVK